MELHVRGRNVPVTDALEAHAEKRMQKLDRVLGSAADSVEVELELSVEHNPSIERSQIAEVTVRGSGPVMRVREADSDMYAAIDLAAHRIERQVQRLRERRKDHHGPGIEAIASTPAELAALEFCEELGNEVCIAEVEREGADLDAGLAEPVGLGGEDLCAAGDEDEVVSTPGQCLREGGAESF